ncbi:MAG: UDP-N-acetylglucosamine 2-epimerase (hydrolyzing) [Phycisphaeraceae bacterium]|nr:UDP-N-acetylglucosamine 2-epimerase (hydrolyzing) [Phycisphaeraceae bacterium]
MSKKKSTQRIKKKTIAVFTGTRAEFGLLKPVMQAIKDHRALNLKVLVGGLHLVQNTECDITDAGFNIDGQIPMQRPSESGRIADSIALGMGIIGFGAVMSRLRPDVVLVLGDRIEAMAGATAASVGGLHVAHIHGGDRAEGVADEAMRHAITKLAHIHFPASKQSAKRIVRLGEPEELVFNVGSPAIDALADMPAADDHVLENCGFAPDEPYAMVLQHPVGLPETQEAKHMRATIKALGKMPFMVVMPNQDPGCEGIRKAIETSRVKVVPHLKREQFIALLKRAAVLVGNSSAGLIEAAAVRKGGVPVVNIGPRQHGREKPTNVIDCDYGKESVQQAIKQALTNPPQCRKHPYGEGYAGKQIADILAKLDLEKLSVGKQNQY